MIPWMRESTDFVDAVSAVADVDAAADGDDGGDDDKDEKTDDDGDGGGVVVAAFGASGVDGPVPADVVAPSRK